MILDELVWTSGKVLCHLPERKNLNKIIRRKRIVESLPNATSLEELRELPVEFTVTTSDDKFLIYDSKVNDIENGRVLVLVLKRNVKLLNRSQVWYWDGTFKVAPSIFIQVFTTLGTVSQNLENPDSQTVSLPFAYCLLSSKNAVLYSATLNVIVTVATDFGISNIQPQKMMSDFKLPIINLANDIFPGVIISACFFHFCQSLYRRFQALGFQSTYKDKSKILYGHNSSTSMHFCKWCCEDFGTFKRSCSYLNGWFFQIFWKKSTSLEDQPENAEEQ